MKGFLWELLCGALVTVVVLPILWWIAEKIDGC
jgi:hypothetical protein